MRNIILGVASAFCLALFLSPLAGSANEPGRDRLELQGPRERDGIESFIALRLRGELRVDIKYFLLIDAARTVSALPLDNAVQAQNADRIQELGDIPLIGGLFGDRPDRAALAPGREIGSVYRKGNTLMVVFDPRITEVPAASSKDIGIDDKRLEEIVRKALAQGTKSARAETRVTIRGGETLPLGSVAVTNRGILFEIRSAEVVRDRAGSGVPVLGDIPLMGALFKDKVGDAYRDRDRLMILISPTVLRDEY